MQYLRVKMGWDNDKSMMTSQDVQFRYLKVESFSAYAYSRRICLLEFVIVFKLENNKKFQQTNPTAIRVCCKWYYP